ncbi:unnamed protein product [Lepeophtheirus salmonis]|uniref:(salmon louse) hypothetical protein n=1 Tax=Lepeophtheirus salmonis TaxID=72036 RepID=A0A7R8CNF2_LEPSM|nr:unnamed protein product [Lepeophtheirus salmonis]CAF2871753.1 unnamed protein product [Lepeophtheirus salmonis]
MQTVPILFISPWKDKGFKEHLLTETVVFHVFLKLQPNSPYNLTLVHRLVPYPVVDVRCVVDSYTTFQLFRHSVFSILAIPQEINFHQLRPMTIPLLWTLSGFDS